MAGLKHFPDKPIERHPQDLEQWDNGDYICQQKGDGWRLEICKSLRGQTLYISRHNKVMDNDVEPEIKEQVARLMAFLPTRSQLDGEWLSRREATNKKSKPHLILFDVIRKDGQWYLNKPYAERWDELQQLWLKAITEHGPDAFPNISLVVTAPEGEFVAFYEAQKTIAQSEGVVIKHKQSTLIGDRKESKINPRWYKIRYRAASDGNMSMDHLRQEQKRQ